MPVSFGFNRFDMRSAEQFATSVREGEMLGYDIAWIPSSPLLVQDPYVLLALAATQTSRIHLGPMIENPVTRHPAVIAGSIATLARLSGGRAELALGVGDTAVRTLGLGPARVAELEAATRTVKGLLAGDKLDFQGTGSRLRHAASAPIWIAAGGPRTLALAGALADGVIIRVGTHQTNIKAAIDQALSGAESAGRDPATLRFGAVFHTVLSDDEAIVNTVGRAIAAGYYEYAPYLFDRIGASWDGPDIEELKTQIWQDFHHTPDLVAAGKLVHFLPDQTLADFCLHGSSTEIHAQLAAIRRANPRISMVVPHPMTPLAAPGEQPHLAFMRDFADSIFPDRDSL